MWGGGKPHKHVNIPIKELERSLFFLSLWLEGTGSSREGGPEADILWGGEGGDLELGSFSSRAHPPPFHRPSLPTFFLLRKASGQGLLSPLALERKGPGFLEKKWFEEK